MMAKNSKRKKKSVIASLDLKNYKAKYTDSYGMGAAKETAEEEYVNEETAATLEPEPPPPVEESKKISPARPSEVHSRAPSETKPPPETAQPLASAPEASATPINPQAPSKTKPSSEPSRPSKSKRKRETKSEEESVESKKAPAEEPREKFEDIVKRIERNKRKMQMRDPVTGELKRRPINTGRADPAKTPVPRSSVDRNPFEHRDDPEVEPEPAVKTQGRRVEIYGIAISSIMLVYSFYVADKAAFFLSMSLLTYLIRPIVGPMFGKHDRTVRNALKGFSIAVFFGAILFIFF